MNGLLAYVAQEPWIQSTSFRNNIVFEKPFNQKFYQLVLERCQLTGHLKTFSAGDATEIGEKGVILSSRQKQKLCLARAVYSNASIYIMDDPLKQLDNHIAKQIFDEVIGPNGILNTKVRIILNAKT